MTYASANITIDDEADMAVVFNPQQVLSGGFVSRENLQVSTRAGAVFLTPDVARALIERLQVALVEAGAVEAVTS